MNITSVNNNKPAFTSRNAIIRQAQDICTLINKEFPYPSCSRSIDMYNDIANKKQQRFPAIEDFLIKFREKSREMVYRTQVALRDGKNKPDGINSYFKAVHNSKIRNCGQSGSIAEFVAKMNGFDDAKKMIVGYRKDGKLDYFDHAIAISGMEVDPGVMLLGSTSLRPVLMDELWLKAPSKAIVIDPWEGFADYAPKAIERYKAHYAEKLGDDMEILFYPMQDLKFNINEIYQLRFENKNLLTADMKKKLGI